MAHLGPQSKVSTREKAYGLGFLILLGSKVRVLQTHLTGEFETYKWKSEVWEETQVAQLWDNRFQS